MRPIGSITHTAELIHRNMAEQDMAALWVAAQYGDLAAVQRLVPLVGRNAYLVVSAPLMNSKIKEKHFFG